MNRRQEYAIDHPVIDDLPTVDKNYCRLDKVAGLNVATILTIDRDKTGKYQWHASLSVRSPASQPANAAINLSPRQNFRMIKHMKKMLEGVGVGEPSNRSKGPVYHMCKDLSDQETTRADRNSMAHDRD